MASREEEGKEPRKVSGEELQVGTPRWRSHSPLCTHSLATTTTTTLARGSKEGGNAVSRQIYTVADIDRFTQKKKEGRKSGGGKRTSTNQRDRKRLRRSRSTTSSRSSNTICTVSCRSSTSSSRTNCSDSEGRQRRRESLSKYEKKPSTKRRKSIMISRDHSDGAKTIAVPLRSLSAESKEDNTKGGADQKTQCTSRNSGSSNSSNDRTRNSSNSSDGMNRRRRSCSKYRKSRSARWEKIFYKNKPSNGGRGRNRNTSSSDSSISLTTRKTKSIIRNGGSTKDGGSSVSRASGKHRGRSISRSGYEKSRSKEDTRKKRERGSSSSDSSSPEERKKRKKEEKKEKKKKKREREHKRRQSTTVGREEGLAGKPTAADSSSSTDSEANDRGKGNASGSVTHQWGKYGRLVEADQWRKRQEFAMWLLDVKDKALESLSTWEERQLFRDYMEDYNTATLPHKKYYDIEAWEAKQAKSGKKKERDEPTMERTRFDDEADRLEEIRQIRDRRKLEALREEFTSMRDDKAKIESMRRQQMLKHQMETLFKLGRHEEAQKLQEILKPDND